MGELEKIYQEYMLARCEADKAGEKAENDPENEELKKAHEMAYNKKVELYKRLEKENLNTPDHYPSAMLTLMVRRLTEAADK